MSGLLELQSDIKQADRFKIHGHTTVDDDYFLALEYVVKRIKEITQEK